MSDSERTKGWWQTLPGLLTATAAVVTALGGFVVALHQTGLLGGSSRSEAPPGAPASGQHAPPIASSPTELAVDAGGGGPVPAAPGAAKEAAARPGYTTVTLRGGSKVSINLGSLRACASNRRGLPSLGGEEIPFSRMSSLEVIGAGNWGTSAAPTRVRVTLLRGGVKIAALPEGCATLYGVMPTGAYEVSWTRVQRIDFRQR